MALTDSILSDDITRLTTPKQPKGVEYAQAAPTTATDAGGGYDVEGAIKASRSAFDIGQQIDALKSQQKEEESARKKAASAAEKAALGKRYGEIRAQYEPELQKPAPEFTPSKETVANLGSLGGMLMVLGAMGGGKGLVGATGAMNAMAGMLKGYQDGRKELFDREKATFEQNFKVWQENRKIIKDTFDRAIKFAPYDLQKATNDTVARLKSIGATTLAASVQKNGLQQTATAVQQADTQFNQVAMPIVNQITAARFPLGVTQAPSGAAPRPMTVKQQIADLEAQKARAEQTVSEAELRKKISPPVSLSAAQEKEKADVEALEKGAGPRQTLSRLLGPEIAKNTDEKVAEKLVSQITNIRNTLDLVKKAEDPDIRFGEIGRTYDRVLSGLFRNIDTVSKTNPNTPVTADQVVAQIDNAARAEGINPNDKNIIFYKEAIFNALELEREARGGSILPVAVMRTLTPLLDPRTQTREQFIGIQLSRANEVARKTGLPQDVLNKGISKVETFSLGPTPKGAPKPSLPRPTTQAEYDALPKGARFIDPDDGKEYIKE